MENRVVEDLEHWRSVLSRRVVWVGFMLALVPNAIALFNEPNTWLPLKILMMVALFALAFLPRSAYRIQASIFSVLAFISGLSILVLIGPEGGSRMYFLLAVLCSGLVLGARVGVLFLALTLLTLLVMTFVSVAEPAQSFMQSGALTYWSWFIFSYVLTAGVMLASVIFVVDRLESDSDFIRHSTKEVAEVQEENREIQFRYMLMARNTNDVIFSLDLNLVFTFVSPSVERYLGIRAETLVGESLAKITTDETYNIWLATLEGYVQRDTKPEKPAPITAEMQLVHADGRIRDVEVFVSFLRNEEGSPEGIFGSCRDIGERKRFERTMDSVLKGISRRSGADFSENLVNNLVQAMGVRWAFVAELKSEGDEKLAKTMAFSQDGQLIDNVEYDLLKSPCADPDCGVCSYADDVQNLFPDDVVLSKYGVESYSGVTILDSKDKMLGLLVVMDDKPMQDITHINEILQIFAAHLTLEIGRVREMRQRIQVEQQLLQSQKLDSVGQLAGGIAHDFNNLLVVIQGNLELARDTIDAQSETAEYLHEIAHASQSAADLTKQILSFSRQQVMQPKPLNLNEVVGGLSEFIRRLLPAYIEYEFAPGRSLSTVEVDPGQIEQAIMNLVVNSRDAMRERGKLRISIENTVIDDAFVQQHPWAKRGQYVMLTVSDNGCGIEPEVLDRIFEPYFTTKAVGEGTGLGLSVYFGVVKQHDGFSYVTSEPGVGTTVNTYLPASEAKPEEIVHSYQKQFEPGSETILLVEDNESVSQLAQRILTRGGYTVETAVNGEQALEVFKARQDSIDMAVLDVVLPGIGGEEIMRQLREVKPDLKVLFTSGYSTDGIHTNFILKQGLKLLQKPYGAQEFLATVRQVLDD